MCTQYLYYIHPFTTFPHVLPPPTRTHPPDRTCSALLVSDFVKEKKWHFCFFKIAIQGVSLWYFHIYIYLSPSLFLLLYIFLLSTLVPLKIPYSFLYRKYIDHIHLLSFLLLPSLSYMWPPLSVTCFT
jgi:hypothetical protein